ncbi:hypothetical protein FMM82_05650 [[Clostridium] clostridioforme]|nr:hypothetical protein [Enterocloster clostridioformis]
MLKTRKYDRMAEINKLEAVEVKWYEKNCNWSDRRHYRCCYKYFLSLVCTKFRNRGICCHGYYMDCNRYSYFLVQFQNE